MEVKNLKVAFVGMRRPPSDMPNGYWSTFVKYHMELPYYYAAHAPIDVVLTTTESVDYFQQFASGGSIRCMTEADYSLSLFDQGFDVIVHWRKWFDELADPLARNVILSQDHSYGDEWLENVKKAHLDGILDGILVFPTWHATNTKREVGQDIRLYEGLTFGVDTDIYSPCGKDPFHLLWASDPGRGLETLINPFLRLWAKDRRFRLTVTYPDYVKSESISRYAGFLKHPGVQHKPGLRNGPILCDLFNTAGILPYSSTFPEPSSRCHRQAQSAGCLVLYPPNMGTPSHTIENGLTGIVEDVSLWPDVILSMVSSGRISEIGHNARTFALTENWAVQANRFYDFFSKGITK